MKLLEFLVGWGTGEGSWRNCWLGKAMLGKKLLDFWLEVELLGELSNFWLRWELLRGDFELLVGRGNC